MSGLFLNVLCLHISVLFNKLIELDEPVVVSLLEIMDDAEAQTVGVGRSLALPISLNSVLRARRDG